MADCETAVKTYVVVRRHRARKPNAGGAGVQVRAAVDLAVTRPGAVEVVASFVRSQPRDAVGTMI